MLRPQTLFVALCSIAAPLAAQRAVPVDAPRPELSLLAGYSSYDLAGTGSAAAAGLFVDYPVLSFLRVEAGSGFIRYSDPTSSAHRSTVFPEVGVRAGIYFGSVQPYLGAGLGVSEPVSSGSGSSQFTLHGVGGLRFLLAPRFSVKGEMRFRSVDPFHGSTADFMGGVALGL